jgi:hypothetical protein
VGGVATSFLGRPRFTQDIDALAILSETEWEAGLQSAPGYGLVARIDKPVEFARRTRVLLLRHVQTSIDIDVILGGLPFEESAVEHGRVYKLGGVDVRLPRVEDLLIMKAVAHRPQDLQDIEGLLDAHPGRGCRVGPQMGARVRRGHGDADIIDDFERLLARRRSSG